MARTLSTRPSATVLDVKLWSNCGKLHLRLRLLRDVSRPVMGGGHAWPSRLIGRPPLLPTPTVAVSGPGGSCCGPPVAVGQKTPPPSRRRLLAAVSQGHGVQGRRAKRKKNYMVEEVGSGVCVRVCECVRGGWRGSSG